MKKSHINHLNKYHNFLRALLLTVILFIIPSLELRAQDKPAPVEPSESSQAEPSKNPAGKITTRVIEEKIAAIEKEDSLEQDIKSQLLSIYKQIISSLQKKEEYLGRTAQNRKSMKTMTQDVEKIQKELKELPNEFPLGISDEMDSKQLLQLKTKVQQNLSLFESEQTKAEQTMSQRVRQRKLLVELNATHAARLKKLQQLIAAPAKANEHPEVTQAIQTRNKIQLETLNTETEAVKEELNRFDAEKNLRLLTQNLELWTRKVGLQKKKFEHLQQILAQTRLKETDQELMQLKEEKTIALLQIHIDETTNYTKKIRDLIELTNQLQLKQKQVDELLEKVSKNERNALEVDRSRAGKSRVFALSLLRELYELPDIEKHRNELNARRSQISEVTYRQIDLRALSRDLLDIDAIVEQEKPKIEQELAKDDNVFLSSIVEKKLAQLLTKKREAIENLEATYSNYLDTLTTLDASQNSLVNTVDGYRKFIRQRIFWIRSGKMIGTESLKSIFQKSEYPFSFENFKTLIPQYRQDISDHFFVHALGVLVWLLLLLLRVQAGKELTAIAAHVQRSKYANILPTLRTMLLTAVIAAPGPLLVLFIGWRLGEVHDDDAFREAVSKALVAIGAAFAILEFFRQSCIRHGLVDSHFNGPIVLSTRIRRSFLSFTLTVLPMFFVVCLLNRLTTDLDRHVLERIFFCAGMLICFLYVRRLLNPRNQLMREVFRLDQGAPIAKTRWLWYPFITLFPLVMVGMAWVGYYYTASQLAWRFLLTILLLSVLLFVWALGIRWFHIAQRWFRLYVLREQRQKPRLETQTIESQRIILAREEANEEKKREQQALRLINSVIFLPLFIGAWFIWADTFPAIEYLDQIPLWHKMAQKEITGTDGTTTVQMVSEAVTLIDFGIAIFVLMATIGLARNLPGMLDFSILQRIGLDASLRYAITSVVGYAVTIIGFVYVFSLLGFRWEQVQWLAATLIFGLSFGLQEIVANFISGLIILFERPIRIGDVVTIEGVTGIVTKIRIRASTVTDWDRKEYLVPNKEIVTGRLLNWTLSDTLNRIVIPVGVAYGTDTEQTRQLLFEIAKNDPEILDEPSTIVTFEAFGDSTLNFVMRAYLGSMDNRLETIHRLHTVINKQFTEAGIEIAFPQQDLHIRSIPEQWNNPV